MWISYSETRNICNRDWKYKPLCYFAWKLYVLKNGKIKD